MSDGWRLAGLAAQIYLATSTCDPISCESEGNTLPPTSKGDSCGPNWLH